MRNGKIGKIYLKTQSIVGNIRYIEHQHINPIKWDNCIHNGNCNFSYGLYDYLDAITNSSWDALILGDYEAVFPLPFKKKMGVYYIYQPIFCQQLGIFGDSKNIKSSDFINSIPRKFLRIHLNLNAYNCDYSSNFLKIKPNFVLPFPHKPELTFNNDALKNIKRLEKYNLNYIYNEPIAVVIQLFHEMWGEINKYRYPIDYELFENTCVKMKEKDQLLTLVVNNENGTLLGGAIFLISPLRLHYICAAPTEAGKKIGVMHGIIDKICRDFENHTIDFEGSSYPSVADFYKKFGGINEPYYRYENNFRLKL